MNDDSYDSITQPSRRRLLGLIGATAILPLAGCLGDDDEEGPTPTPTPEEGTHPITFQVFNDSDEPFGGNIWFVREPFQGVTITDFDGRLRQVDASTVSELLDVEWESDIAEMEIHGTASKVVPFDISAGAQQDKIVSIWSDMSIFFTVYPQQEPHGNVRSDSWEKLFLEWIEQCEPGRTGFTIQISDRHVFNSGLDCRAA